MTPLEGFWATDGENRSDSRRDTCSFGFLVLRFGER